MDLTTKTDPEIETWIRNYENAGKTSETFYLELLEERVRRTQLKQRLDFDRSLEHLKQAAIDHACISYGELAKASGVEWSKARHQMNGSSGHLDRLLDLCYARGLPLLTATCVNQDNVADGELGEEALAGFVAGARRLGLVVHDPREFHHRCRDECWEWGAKEQSGD
ncbi:hypothetical protein G7076_02975 [Sphingomonas sp. HDW15A]|uniref:hypothetical protein n=1 Tax=Sphingomonas sp. HDW15A TaxID=2714942 RepID=UPI00140DA069|nr:hypothetical protein [Sphingomonas sp. HDW15A]QIK95579.1 hypothetical protein G7076_02975 [Sphingomonas sp. HDW15A]